MAIVPVNVSVVTLDPGMPVTVVNGAAATSANQIPPFAQSQQFGVQVRPDGGDRSVIFESVPTAITILTSDLEASSDGAATFQAVTTFDFVAAKVQTYLLLPGLVYRLNIKTLTGTSILINAVVN